MKKMRRITILLLTLLFVGGTCGCAHKEKVQMKVWSSPASQDLIREMAEEFIELHKKEADIEIVVQAQDEDTMVDTAVGNPEQVADVFAFAGDQTPRLYNAGLLLDVEETESVCEVNGGADSSAIQAATVDGKLCAYPLTASNGYFLYYNGAYFSEKDVSRLDDILEIAAENGKYFSMDWTSGWYIYSFFGGAGMHIGLDEAENRNFCDWNKTDGAYKGTDVAKAMLDIAAHESFRNTDDLGFRTGVADGEIIAGINGPWNDENIKQCWGDDYRAIKLPTYTVNGQQVQMASFSGYKMIGVKKDSDCPKWASEFALFITNEENQLKRFELTGECPANIHAAKAQAVQASPAVMALAGQAPYSIRQSIAQPFWNPSNVFGTVMAAGNPDGRDLQELLDELVEAATAPES